MPSNVWVHLSIFFVQESIAAASCWWPGRRWTEIEQQVIALVEEMDDLGRSTLTARMMPTTRTERRAKGDDALERYPLGISDGFNAR